jgi:23S rRNA (guanosine2251-2'-O)-methyltransferase
MKKGKPHRKNKERRGPPGRHEAHGHAGAKGGLWLYGLHAVKAALLNPQRKLHRLVLTPRSAEELGRESLQKIHTELAEMEAISRLLPPGSVHQGAALLCEPLPKRDLKDVLGEPAEGRRIVAVLDQLTDPHNVGAVLRSCAAFDVAAVIVQDRHAPPESGVLAKAASGALDRVPLVTVVNIARALEELGDMGFWRIALAGDGEMSLQEAAPLSDIVLVLGAEGAGVRRLVRERCDSSVRIPIANAMESLNVSNAAAIALYEMRRR